METSTLKEWNLVHWTLAASLGVLSWIIPGKLIASTPETSLLLTSICLLTLGAFLGILHPDHPWRWGIAVILFFPLADIQVFFENEQFVLSYLFIKIPVYLIHSLPALLGAYMAALSQRLKRGAREETNLHELYPSDQ